MEQGVFQLFDRVCIVCHSLEGKQDEQQDIDKAMAGDERYVE